MLFLSPIFFYHFTSLGNDGSFWTPQFSGGWETKAPSTGKHYHNSHTLFACLICSLCVTVSTCFRFEGSARRISGCEMSWQAHSSGCRKVSKVLPSWRRKRSTWSSWISLKNMTRISAQQWESLLIVGSDLLYCLHFYTYFFKWIFSGW